ncbi:MAG: amidohydrolase [Gammaproteobacteria bacterium]|nr:amidohydrolase [Gammaproteobacteria bacterium]
MRAFLICTLIVFGLVGCSPSDKMQTNSNTDSVDLILTNGEVYTFSWSEPNGNGEPSDQAPFNNSRWVPDATTIVIDKGKIIAVGDDAIRSEYESSAKKVIDLKGNIVLPGLIDSHVHIAELGEVLSRANLIGVKTHQEAVERVMNYAKENNIKEGEWIVGQGWDEGAWADNYPTRSILDKAFPHNPVVLKSLHGFAVWANSKALVAANISASTQSPVGGFIVQGENGLPSGILLNRATTLMMDAIPPASDQVFEQWVLAGLNRMANDGYVAIHQAGADSRHINAFESLHRQNKLPIKVYAMISARDSELVEEWISRGPYIDPDGWFDVRSVKAYYDGALGSRGARLLDDYADQPGHKGVSGNQYGYNQVLVKRLMAKGFQVGIHAIGDAGNRETLDFFAEYFAKNPEAKSNRHRIEHAQILHPDDLPRLAELDIIASMEPAHAVEDKKWAETRLGPVRIAGAYAWRDLRRVNTKLILNSDLPGSDHSFFYGLHSAVTRKDKQMDPEDGWYPEQRLTAEETIFGFTRWPAFASFRENSMGQIKVGYAADLTVMNIDPLNMSSQQPSRLLNGKIMMTLVNGSVVNN